MYVFVAVKPQTRRLAVARLKHHAERCHSYSDEDVQQDAGKGKGEEAKEANGTRAYQGTSGDCRREEEDKMDAKEDG